MTIPDEIRKCVCFVAIQDKITGNYIFKGTAFFVSHLHDRGFAYIVTAKHIIDKAKNHGCQEVHLRFNMRDGSARWMAIKVIDWVFHDSPTENVDIAVLPFYRDSIPFVDHDAYPLAHSATN